MGSFKEQETIACILCIKNVVFWNSNPIFNKNDEKVSQCVRCFLISWDVWLTELWIKYIREYISLSFDDDVDDDAVENSFSSHVYIILFVANFLNMSSTFWMSYVEDGAIVGNWVEWAFVFVGNWCFFWAFYLIWCLLLQNFWMKGLKKNFF